MKHISNFESFLNESSLISEGDVNLSQQFALVLTGGSIGSRPKYPVFTRNGMGSIVETSDDKEALIQDAKRMRKMLSPGERKYYGMGYTVIELTPRKISEIEMLQSAQNKAQSDTEIE